MEPQRTTTRQVLVQAHADTWWLSARDGIMRDSDRRVLTKQRRALELTDEDIAAVADVLNSRFASERDGIFLGFTYVGIRLRDLISWEFSITAQDLMNVEVGFTSVSPGCLAQFISGLWTLLTYSQTDCAAYRFQILLNVLQRVFSKLLMGNWRSAQRDAASWLAVSHSVYLTLFSVYVKNLIRLEACVVLILWYIWQSWGNRRRTCMQLVLWLFSAYAKRVIDTWVRAMKPRLPFLNIRLEKRYIDWEKRTKSD
mmetsp:Transcript_108114/g.214741  ORF Transcript_108114/g.214741 Transcript_108114/m.214741 type:complete len:255 (+) Transcript_108114:55-819(+)